MKNFDATCARCNTSEIANSANGLCNQCTNSLREFVNQINVDIVNSSVTVNEHGCVVLNSQKSTQLQWSAYKSAQYIKLNELLKGWFENV